MAQELNVVELYNDLHQTPELGFQECKTSAYIAEKLKEMGYAVKDSKEGYTISKI